MGYHWVGVPPSITGALLLFIAIALLTFGAAMLFRPDLYHRLTRDPIYDVPKVRVLGVFAVLMGAFWLLNSIGYFAKYWSH